MRLTGKYVRNLLMSVQRAEIGKENGEQNGDVYCRHRESDTPFSVLIVENTNTRYICFLGKY